MYGNLTSDPEPVFMQIVRFLQPHPGLRPFIHSYTFFEHQIEDWDTSYCWHLPAWREFTMQLFLDDIPVTLDGVTGQDFSPSHFDILGVLEHSFVDTYMPRKSRRIQIGFFPAGFYRLTGIPASLFTNVNTPVSEVLGRIADEIVEQLWEKPCIKQQASVLDRFLLSLLDKRACFSPTLIEQLALQLMHFQSEGSVRSMANECALSKRQLERVFKEQIGTSPKKFYCINRFFQANQFKNKYPHKDWLSIALQCGYYDLNHLSKDFKIFGRATPSQFEGYIFEQERVIPKHKE